MIEMLYPEINNEGMIKSREVRSYEIFKKQIEPKSYFYHTNEHRKWGYDSFDKLLVEYDKI